MKNILLLIILIISVFSFNSYALLFDDSIETRTYDINKSNWQINIGFVYRPYTINVNYSGSSQSYDEIKFETPFLNVGTAYEIRAGRFSITPKVSIFGTTANNSDTIQLSETNSSEISKEEKSFTSFGGEGLLNLSLLFETSYFNIQPFIEGGYGFGIANSKLSFSDNVSPENFEATFDDSYAYVTLGGGVNFISSQGLQFALSVYYSTYNSIDRTTEDVVSSSPYSAPSVAVLNSELSAQLSAGYRF